MSDVNLVEMAKATIGIICMYALSLVICQPSNTAFDKHMRQSLVWSGMIASSRRVRFSYDSIWI